MMITLTVLKPVRVVPRKTAAEPAPLIYIAAPYTHDDPVANTHAVIRIADAGSFAGKVSIDVAEIHGRFEGELTARSQLIIHSTGRVSGKIRYGKLVIDEGGELCGEISALGGDAPASQATAPRLRAESPLPLSVAG